MKIKFYLAILFVLVVPACNQPAARPDPAQSSHTGSRRDITYCSVNGVDLKMDLYAPENLTGHAPAAVYVHGGGWSRGDKSSTGGEDIRALTQAGFVVFSVNYRLAPEYHFPAMIEDVKCSIRSVRAHAEEYNIDPDHIGAFGGSAGGQLVNLLGTSTQSAGFDVGEYLEYSSRVQSIVDMFGPADFTMDFPGGYKKLEDKVFGGFDPVLASPVTYVTPDDPPFLILHGDQDTLAPLEQSQILYDKDLSKNNLINVNLGEWCNSIQGIVCVATS